MHKKYYQKYCFIKELDTKHILNQKKNTVFIYRNYKKKIDINEILDIKKLCKRTGNKLYLSNNIKLSLKLDLDGAYIPSFIKNLGIQNLNFKKKFLLMGSAHNIYEIRRKESQGVNLIFLSPLFKTKNYKKGMGVMRFNLLTHLSKKKFIALGGINKKNIKKLKIANIYGFSGISYFFE